MLASPENDNPAIEKARVEQDLNRQRKISIALGLFQEEVTIRTLLESLAQGVIIIDTNQNIIFANTHAAQMFGYSANELIGKHHNILLPERFQNIHHRHMEDYFREPRTRPMGIGLDLFGLHNDGSEFPLEISLSFVKTSNGIMIISLINDISFRKQVEKNLEDTIERLADANKDLESFAYSVSHDLKAPLQTLLGFSRLIMEEYHDKVDFTFKDYLSRIVNSSEKMKELIEDILELSRISRQEIVREDGNLSNMVTEIVEELRRANPERDVDVHIRDNLIAKIDKKLMSVVLTNIVGNAWKFTSKVEKAHIEFGAYQKNSQWVYFIKDNGAGFNMNQYDKLFRPFDRLHSDKEFKGTGIGLAIVDRALRKHGGKIWAESEVGSGATFFFTLKQD